MPDRESHFDELLDSVADLAPIAENDERVDAMRAEGEGWLSENMRVLSEVARHGAGPDLASVVPERIGPYTILERIGAGGMGEVYLAKQTEPMRRHVALKVIKAGMDSKRVVARFESERQALALMDHPNIAKVYEAGLGEDGRPYFALEHVKGVPITDYCELHRLDTRERLHLFRDVCEAVHHAHQTGIIHRDLKPSNILVSVVEGRALPKVIDFGVAKAIAHDLTELTLHTEIGQLVGTPEYMSPEQAEMTGLNVDTRTDIYSLGVLLYELLTGVLPFEPDVLRAGGIAEIHRVLREKEPPTPSTRVSTAGDDGESTDGRVRNPALARALRGDLDWITMKAMEKDRTRRYASASELSADVLRHLRHEPVLAGPPGAAYRIAKFARRNRLAVTSAAAVLAMLVGGMATTSWQAARARRAEADAKQQAAVATAVNEFMRDMLAQAHPETNPLGREMTVAEALDAAARKLPGAFEGQPLVEAAVRLQIGDAFDELARFDEAREHLARAVQLYRDAGTPDDLANALHFQTTTRIKAGLVDEAEKSAREELALVTAEHGNRDALVVQATMDLASALGRKGAYEQGDSLFAAALHMARTTPEVGDLSLAAVLGRRSETLRELGRFDEAEAHAREALTLYQTAGDDDSPNTIRSLSNLARVLTEQGDREGAREYYEQSLDAMRRVYGPDHPSVATSLEGLGAWYRDAGDLDRAEPLIREALRIRREIYGDRHKSVSAGLSNLGSLLLSREDLDGAEAVFREALGIDREIQPDNPAEIFRSTNNLAATLRSQGKLVEAERLFREARSLGVSAFGEEHYQVAMVKHNLAKTLSDAGRYEDADEQFLSAIALAEKTFPPGNVNVDIMRGNRGELLLRMKRYREAEPVLVAAHRAIASQLGEDHVRATRVAAWLEQVREEMANGKPVVDR